MASRSVIRTWTGHRINDLAVTRDGSRAVAVTSDKKIKIIDLATFAERMSVIGRTPTPPPVTPILVLPC